MFMSSANCAKHNEPECLCDVVVQEPAPILFGIGTGPMTVEFSEYVAREVPIDDPIEHLSALAKFYDKIADRLPDARAAIAALDDEEYSRMESGDDHARRFQRRFVPTPEQEYWLRRDIPASWCAWNIDVPPSTIRRWREVNGVKITPRSTQEEYRDWTFSQNSKLARERMQRINTQRAEQFDVHDPRIAAILFDPNLNNKQAAEQLGWGLSSVQRKRKEHNYQTHRTVIGGVASRDWTAPDVIEVLDSDLSHSEAARRLGCSKPTVIRQRQTRANMRD